MSRRVLTRGLTYGNGAGVPPVRFESMTEVHPATDAQVALEMLNDSYGTPFAKMLENGYELVQLGGVARYVSTEHMREVGDESPRP